MYLLTEIVSTYLWCHHNGKDFMMLDPLLLYIVEVFVKFLFLLDGNAEIHLSKSTVSMGSDF